MYWLSLLAYWEGLILLGGFCSIMLWKLMTGEISLQQLLDGDILDPDSADGSGYSTEASAGRAQLLIMTLFAAVYYLLQVIHDPTSFPKLPGALVVALGGSQAAYLGGKAQAMLLGRFQDVFKRRL